MWVLLLTLFLPFVKLSAATAVTATQAHNNAVAQAVAFVQRLNTTIFFPFIALLSGIALLVFMYGAAKYIASANNASAREEGVRQITFGIIGLVVMIAAYAILSLLAGTFGLDQQLFCATNPTDPACVGSSNPFISP